MLNSDYTILVIVDNPTNFPVTLSHNKLFWEVKLMTNLTDVRHLMLEMMLETMRWVYWYFAVTYLMKFKWNSNENTNEYQYNWNTEIENQEYESDTKGSGEFRGDGTLPSSVRPNLLDRHLRKLYFLREQKLWNQNCPFFIEGLRWEFISWGNWWEGQWYFPWWLFPSIAIKSWEWLKILWWNMVSKLL